MKRSEYSTPLLQWYSANARDLPWRGQSDPYAVWISEIMLQQTRVETVIPYYVRWMKQFPSIEALAEAPQQEVLSAWEGLGYYSRALNLQCAARIVVHEHGGKLPRDPLALRKLPGIGRYTAGAIASLAFGLDEPVLDGNIRRVLARVFNVTEPLRSAEAEHRMWELAKDYLPPGRAAAYNQALMELGATLCTPRSPGCPRCPLAEVCQARHLNVQEERPVMPAKPAVPHYIVTAAVIARERQVLIAQRPIGGLLGGMWEFPGGKLLPGETLEACLKREIHEELGVQIEVQGPLGQYRHAYTHFRVTLHAFCCRLANGDQPKPLQVSDLRWVKPEALPEFPMGKIDRLIAAQIEKRYAGLAATGIQELTLCSS